jgi:hypothetical protein
VAARTLLVPDMSHLGDMHCIIKQRMLRDYRVDYNNNA